MKIHISPPQVAMRVPLHATSSQGAVDMEPRRQDYDRLDLTRQRKFRTIGRGKSESEVDEAAIALVELSVLVYDDIGTIGKTAAKLRDPRLTEAKIGGLPHRRKIIHQRARPIEDDIPDHHSSLIVCAVLVQESRHPRCSGGL